MASASLLYPAVAVGLTITGIILLRRYAAGRVCHSQKKLDGKTVIITGSNSGIGKETAIDLASRNARIILACRDEQRGQMACCEVKQRSGSENIVYHQLDLADLQSVRRFAAKILDEEPQIDILINNAGVMGCPYRETKDGFEMQFGVNHLGHFLLTHLLLDRLQESAPSRIVNVSSRAHLWGKIDFDDLMGKRSYSRLLAYSQSKLANVLFTRQLAKQLEGTDVTAYSLHPGVVRTELGHHFYSSPWIHKLYVMLFPIYWAFSKSPWQGAQTNIYCAVAEELDNVSGKYYCECAEKTPGIQALDDGVAKKLWEVSEKLTGLSGSE